MDIINIISIGAISIQAMLAVVFVIIDKIDKRQDSNKLSEPKNPLLLTIKAMESELSELKENNIHMERIAQLEKDIEEANKQAEALSKVAGNYDGSTMEEVGESMQHSIPNSKKLDDGNTRQNTAHFRTYTRQAGWSSYYDVTFK